MKRECSITVQFPEDDNNPFDSWAAVQDAPIYSKCTAFFPNGRVDELVEEMNFIDSMAFYTPQQHPNANYAQVVDCFSSFDLASKKIFLNTNKGNRECFWDFF